MPDQAKGKEIRELLNSPDVPEEQKKNLVFALGAVDPTNDYYQYAEKYGVLLDLHAMDGGQVDAAIAKAKEYREVGTSIKRLEQGGDVANSNHLLDDGAPGLRFFEKFLPL
ncbi:hypothetical protein, partial [Streptomyces griseoaurantiacus]